jgi:beta-aspartyl-peptidase (threonine type)
MSLNPFVVICTIFIKINVMKSFPIICILFLSPLLSFGQAASGVNKSGSMKKKFTIAIHGGAGNLQKRNFTPEQEEEYKKVLKQALQVGYERLDAGDSAVNTVEAVIKIMEDSPLFNAGKGSVFTNEGTNEMDAAIMDGKTLKCGAITNVRTIKNPISGAKAVMQKSKFVFLSGHGADRFAKDNGVEIVDTSYFFEQYMIQSLDSVDKFGTVGCVVLDNFGNLAAGTSTGGIVNKKYNRVGDSPIIGAGTYANNKTCAVSCTGHGEDFIRLAAAYDVSAQMEYKHLSLDKAADNVIQKKLKQIKGRGGMVAVDRKGKVVFSFNTSGMFRGYIKANGETEVKILQD